MSGLRVDLEKLAGEMDYDSSDGGAKIRAVLAAHPVEPAPDDYSVEEIAAKIADQVPHADLDGFTLSERLRIGKAIAPLFRDLMGGAK